MADWNAYEATIRRRELTALRGEVEAMQHDHTAADRYQRRALTRVLKAIDDRLEKLDG